MQETLTATQKIVYRIPPFPHAIIMSTGQQMMIQDISEEAISDIFDAMKQNAIDYMKEKTKVKIISEKQVQYTSDDGTKKPIEQRIARAAGVAIANKIG